MENSEKKRFFELMEPKSALIIGIVAGVLVLCTIGFIVLGAMALTRGINCSANAGKTLTANIDTAAAAASQPVTQAPKSDRPKVELFVMAYCPYGLQMEKAYLPVMELLKNRADIDIKFVSYSMHGKKEIDENTRQYCIGKEQTSKYVTYLKCFTGKDDYQACLTSAGINMSQLNSCVSKTDKQFGITAKYNDKSTWLNGTYPVYPIYSDLNDKYGVQGSPTLVINGAQVDAARSPEAVKQTVCGAFNNPPSECNQTLDGQSTSPGFGVTAGANTDASCS